MWPLRIAEVNSTWNHTTTSHRSSSCDSFWIFVPFIRFAVALGKLQKKNDYWLHRDCPAVCLSVRPRDKTRSPPDGFSWSLTLESFQKIFFHEVWHLTVFRKYFFLKPDTWEFSENIFSWTLALESFQKIFFSWSLTLDSFQKIFFSWSLTLESFQKIFFHEP